MTMIVIHHGPNMSAVTTYQIYHSSTSKQLFFNKHPESRYNFQELTLNRNMASGGMLDHHGLYQRPRNRHQTKH